MGPPFGLKSSRAKRAKFPLEARLVSFIGDGYKDGAGVPADFEPALTEIKDRFGYRSFNFIDTVLLFATTDSGSARVRTPVSDGGVFDVGFDRATWIYGEPKSSVSARWNREIAVLELLGDGRLAVSGDGQRLP